MGVRGRKNTGIGGATTRGMVALTGRQAWLAGLGCLRRTRRRRLSRVRTCGAVEPPSGTMLELGSSTDYGAAATSLFTSRTGANSSTGCLTCPTVASKPPTT